MYIKRHCENLIIKAAHSFPCIVVYGPRQVGKSTTVNRLFGKEFTTVTLDDLDDRNLAINNPRLFLDTYKWPVVIDEIQKAPGLLEEIKIRIDSQRIKWMENDESRCLMYVLTGSNRFELQQGVSESLAGRCGIIEMYSISQQERNAGIFSIFSPDIASLFLREKEHDVRAKSRDEVFEDIYNGGMPDVVSGITERNLFFKSYVNTYIEKDVRKLISAASEMQFRNFLTILALRTACELRYEELSNSVGTDVRTCKRWISILETSGIIYLLHPYISNISKRIIKSPKIYFTDTGLCSYLCKWQDSEMLKNGAMGGAIFETFVVSEILKNLSANNLDPRDYLYYYRDTDKKEVDLLYVDQGSLYPIEIKKGINPSKPTKNFSVLSKYNMNIMPGLVIDSCDRIRPINENAYTIPVHLI